MTDAKQFFDQMADLLRSKGRTVEITETTESFGTFVWLYSPAPHWYERTISLSVSKNARPGSRWRLGALSVGSSGTGTKAGRAFKRELRNDIRIAVGVYA